MRFGLARSRTRSQFGTPWLARSWSSRKAWTMNSSQIASRKRIGHACGSRQSEVHRGSVRDPLRRFARPMFKHWGLLTVSDLPARGSAEICVVDVKKKLRMFTISELRATFSGDPRGRSKSEGCLPFCDPCAALCGVVSVAVALCDFVARAGLWKSSRGLRSWIRHPAVAGSIPSWSAAAPARNRSCQATSST